MMAPAWGVGPASRSHGGLDDGPAGRSRGGLDDSILRRMRAIFAFAQDSGRGDSKSHRMLSPSHARPYLQRHCACRLARVARQLAPYFSPRCMPAGTACQPAPPVSRRAPPSWIPPARSAPRVTNVLRAMGKRRSRLTKLLSSPLIPTVILGIRYRSKMPQRRVRAGGRGASVSQSLHIITCACCRSIPRLPRRRCRVARA